MNDNIWQLLGIEKTTDIATIRQAYRAKLPNHHPETDPDGFKALRAAYENAIEYAKSPEKFAAELESDSSAQDISQPLTEEQFKENEICTAYQMLLNDPKRRFNVDEWQLFISSFYDYPMAIIDSVKWRLLEISTQAKNISQSCAKLLAESLRWRQQLMIEKPEQYEKYENFLEYIDSGDTFNYASLPTTNIVLQDATIDYISHCHWLYWWRSQDELESFLMQDTVICLPDDKDLMMQFANFYRVANIPNQSILDYALQRIAQNDDDERNIIEWRFLAAIQYTLLTDKQNALQAWIDLYNTGHYQQKAASWIAGWCLYFAQEYFPLLCIALNDCYCLAPTSTDNNFYNIVPQWSTITVSRLAQIDPSDYSPEIASFINWALEINWNYRQILPLLLLDNGTNRLYRLYRHAIMLCHGNQTLLQQILEEQSDDIFEQFILQNLQRQAKQHLVWLTELEPIKAFKDWLYNSDEDLPMPIRFDIESDNDDAIYVRLWLDRFDLIPKHAKVHLYRYMKYFNMEMFDWQVYFDNEQYYQFPFPPNALIDKEVYWQWYRSCMLVLAITNNPLETAKLIKKENSDFILADDDPFLPLVNIFKYGNWQNESELYNLIINNNEITNCVLSNYPNSIENIITNPYDTDFTQIPQHLTGFWQTKLANENPIYLMLLYKIVLNKTAQQSQLEHTLQTIAGDNLNLQKIAHTLINEKRLTLLAVGSKSKAAKQAIFIAKLAKHLSNPYGICVQKQINALDQLRTDASNNLVLRLCAALLLAENQENQEKLNAQSLPKNGYFQFWRWNGRTNNKGFFIQTVWMTIFLFLIETRIPAFLKNLDLQNFDYLFRGMLFCLIFINLIFAIKRRVNDTDTGKGFNIFRLWQPSIEQTNRYGPPINEKEN